MATVRACSICSSLTSPRRRAPSRVEKSLKHPVSRSQDTGPTVSGAENVPRAQNRRIQAAFTDRSFALCADREIGLHHGCRLRDAHLEEVLNSGRDRRGDGFPAGDQVDAAKLRRPGLGWDAARRPAARRSLRASHGPGRRSHQCTYPVAALKQAWYQAAADVARPTGDEYVLLAIIHRRILPIPYS